MKQVMKGIAATVAGFTIAAAPAWSEDAKPAAKPAASKPATPAKDAKASPAAHKSRRHEDARACLERTSDSEVIKCAEAYL